MGQKISKVDDPAHLGNPSGKFGMILVQAVYRLADNFELALLRSQRPRIGSEGGTATYTIVPETEPSSDRFRS